MFKKFLLSTLLLSFSCMATEQLIGSQSGSVNAETQTLNFSSPVKITCDPTYDVTFKSLFGDEKNGGKQRTISLLNNLLGINVIDLKFLPTINEGFYAKKTIFDILCQCVCQNGNETYTVDIEMQKKAHGDYFDRTVLYSGQLSANTTIPNQAYSEASLKIVISFLDYVLAEHADTPVFAGRIVKTPMQINENTKLHPVVVLSDKLQFYYLQLPLIGKAFKYPNLQSELSCFNHTGQLWLKLLSYKHIPETLPKADHIEIPIADFDDAIVQNALDLLEACRTGEKYEKFKAEVLSRNDSEQIWLSDQKRAKAEGKAEGEAEGKWKTLIKHQLRKFQETPDNFEFSKWIKKVPEDFMRQELKFLTLRKVDKNIIEQFLLRYKHVMNNELVANATGASFIMSDE
ncbi:MAG: hypothetical protein EOM50_20840 [Erysipelotrichia bacterium]|nr:hypothetical protein [Erysipelotrichia bacterium]